MNICNKLEEPRNLVNSSLFNNIKLDLINSKDINSININPNAKKIKQFKFSYFE